MPTPSDNLLSRVIALEEKLRRHSHNGYEDVKLNHHVDHIVADFNTNEQYSLNLYAPYAFKITRVRGRTIEAMGPSDDGTIIFKNTAGDTMATLTASAGTAINTDLTPIIPSTNNLIDKDKYYQIVVNKSTAGGKVQITIEWERL